MKHVLILAIALFTQFNLLLSQDGILDPTFDLDGFVRMDINNSNDVMKSIVTQADGKIIVVGYTSNLSSDNYCLARFNLDGSIDNGFGLNGVVVTAFPNSSVASDVAIQNDGKIVVAGHTGNEFAIARYTTSGLLDTSFGNQGIAYTSFSGNGAITEALKIQTNGKIIVGGQVLDSPPDGSSFVLVRYNQDGTLDTTFGIGGIVTTDVAPGAGLNALDQLKDLAIQQNGKIVVSGLSGPNTVLIRYNSEGSLDLNFDSNGMKVYNYSQIGNSSFSGLDIQQDGKIIAVGFSTGMNGFSDLLVVRHNIDGSLDNNFGNLGIIIIELSQEQDGAVDVRLQEDNKILVGGFINDTIFKCALARYDTNGNPDLTFGINGLVKTAIDPFYNGLEAIAIQADGKILTTGFVGNYPYDFAIARYTSTVLSTPIQAEVVTELSIFPNPTSDKVTVNFVPKNNEDLLLSVYNTSGQMLYEKIKTSLNPPLKTTETIQLEDYTNGVYFIDISSSETHQLIKVVKK